METTLFPTFSTLLKSNKVDVLLGGEFTVEAIIIKTTRDPLLCDGNYLFSKSFPRLSLDHDTL